MKKTRLAAWAAALAAAGAAFFEAEASQPLGTGITHYYDFEETQKKDGTHFTVPCRAWDAAASAWTTNSERALTVDCTDGGTGLKNNDHPKFGTHYLNGAGNQVRIDGGDAPFLCPSGNVWTISFWALRQNAKQRQQLLVNGTRLNMSDCTSAKLAETSTENLGFGFYVIDGETNSTPSTGKVGVRLSETTNGTDFAALSIVSRNAFQWKDDAAFWHNVMLIRDGARLALYVDGAEQGAADMTADAYIVAPGNSLYTVQEKDVLGAGTPTMAKSNGLDEIAIWGRALRPGEIAAVSAGDKPVSGLAALRIRSGTLIIIQ